MDGYPVSTEQLRKECAAALANRNVQAFLRVIREGETSQGDEAYFTQVFGARLGSLDDHPREVIRGRIGGKVIPSSAAGAYQFLRGTWDECVQALGLKDFGQHSQDLAAVFLIRRRQALDDVKAGRFESAVKKCAREWASLPGSPYGQPVKTMTQARAVYEQWRGEYDNEPVTATLEGADMPLGAFLTAALPSIVQSVPLLGKLFGSGSDVAERNIKAAELAVQIVQQATGAKNVQETAEVLKADPEMAKVATEAVQERWHELTEAGGGGIDGARKADAAVSERRDMLYSPSFWVALPLLVIVMMIVGAVVGLWGTPFSEDVRSAIANGIPMLILGGLIGYYYGQTTSRNRT